MSAAETDDVAQLSSELSVFLSTYIVTFRADAFCWNSTEGYLAVAVVGEFYTDKLGVSSSFIAILVALVVYEYLITIDQELAVVWKRQWTPASALLISLRWVMILSQVFHWLNVYPNVRALSLQT